MASLFRRPLLLALRALTVLPLAVASLMAACSSSESVRANEDLADYSIYDHGKECFEKLGVPVFNVVEFSCDGPLSSRLKVEVDGKEVTDYVPEKCDKPDLVAMPALDGEARFDCVPGGRVTKMVQKNAAGHDVVTVVACRRTALHPMDSGLYENIAMIQSNLVTNDTCWYQIRQPGNAPPARHIVPPYTPGHVKGDAVDVKATELYVSPVTLTSDNSECFRCHDNHVWLRTPWIRSDNQVKSSPEIDNEIPRTEGQPNHIGRPFKHWNNPKNRPARISIDRALFDQTFPPSAEEAVLMAQGKMAPSNACTQCHALGKASIANPYEGSCNAFARFWMPDKGAHYAGTTAGMRMTSHGAAFPLRAWMPPGASQQFKSGEEYEAFYKRAFKSISLCCEDPTRAGCSAK